MKTLKTLIVLTVIFFVTQTLNAQIRVGLLGGLNMSELDIKDFSSGQTVDTKTFMNFGAVVDFQLSENIGLRAEVMSNNHGGTLKQTSDDPDINFDASFLEIPLMVRYQFGESVKPFIMAGPSIGLLLSHDIEVEMAGLAFKSDIKDVTESMNFSIALGAGIEIPLKMFNVFVEAKYNLALTNLSKTGNIELKYGGLSQSFQMKEDENEYKYKSFQINAGVTIAL